MNVMIYDSYDINLWCLTSLTFPGLVAGLVVNRLLLSGGRITPDRGSMLEFDSTAGIIICYAWVWLDSRYYQVALPETGSTEGIIAHYCYPVLETGSTVVPKSSSTANIKVHEALQFVSFERREDTPDRTSNLNWSSLNCKYKCGKSSYAAQCMRLRSLGDVVIHQLSECGSYARLPQVRILPVKLPQVRCAPTSWNHTWARALFMWSKCHGSGCSTTLSGMHRYLYRVYCLTLPTSLSSDNTQNLHSSTV